MIVLIGEAALEDFQDKNRVNTVKHFWSNHLLKTGGFSQGFVDTFKLNFPLIQQRKAEYIAEEMVKVIQELTGRNRNRDLTRLMMNCVTFDDLYRELRRLYPEFYALPEKVAG